MLAFMAADRGALRGVGDPSPVELSGRAPTVLAIHGFGGTPVEVSLVVEVAQELGLGAHAPLLPGHGTHARDLARTRWSDWRSAAEGALDAACRPAKAIVIGLSLGSLLAAHLAAARGKDVQALGMLASAPRLSWPFGSGSLISRRPRAGRTSAIPTRGRRS